MNMILLWIFTLSESCMVSHICGYFEPRHVLEAALATAGATFGVILFAWKANHDFPKLIHFFDGNLLLNIGFFWCFVMMIVWVILVDLFIVKGSTFL